MPFLRKPLQFKMYKIPRSAFLILRPYNEHNLYVDEEGNLHTNLKREVVNLDRKRYLDIPISLESDCPLTLETLKLSTEEKIVEYKGLGTKHVTGFSSV